MESQSRRIFVYIMILLRGLVVCVYAMLIYSLFRNKCSQTHTQYTNIKLEPIQRIKTIY